MTNRYDVPERGSCLRAVAEIIKVSMVELLSGCNHATAMAEGFYHQHA